MSASSFIFFIGPFSNANTVICIVGIHASWMPHETPFEVWQGVFGICCTRVILGCSVEGAGIMHRVRPLLPLRVIRVPASQHAGVGLPLPMASRTSPGLIGGLPLYYDAEGSLVSNRHAFCTGRRFKAVLLCRRQIASSRIVATQVSLVFQWIQIWMCMAKTPCGTHLWPGAGCWDR